MNPNIPARSEDNLSVGVVRSLAINTSLLRIRVEGGGG